MHYRIVALKCEHVIEQCRCPGPKITKFENDCCPKCKASEPHSDSEDATSCMKPKGNA